ncbi:MAG: hypothetical protein AAF919_19350, partial [Pseudomonadota bacterium]
LARMGVPEDKRKFLIDAVPETAVGKQYISSTSGMAVDEEELVAALWATDRGQFLRSLDQSEEDRSEAVADAKELTRISKMRPADRITAARRAGKA